MLIYQFWRFIILIVFPALWKVYILPMNVKLYQWYIVILELIPLHKLKYVYHWFYYTDLLYVYILNI